MFIQAGNNVVQGLAWKRLLAAKNGDVTVDEEFLKDISLSLGRMAKTAAINEDRERKIRDDERQMARQEMADKATEFVRDQGTSVEQSTALREFLLQVS